MRIYGRGILLQRLTLSEIELVREWRNAPHVQSRMEYRQEISPASQVAWFSRIDNNRNWYFLFGELADKWVGVCHLKDVEGEEAEAGVFTGQSEYLRTHLPVKAVLLMMDFAFDQLGLKALRAKMRADQPAILAFNEQLGYRATGKPSPEGFIRMRVEAATYRETAARLRKMAGVEALRVDWSGAPPDTPGTKSDPELGN